MCLIFRHEINEGVLAMKSQPLVLADGMRLVDNPIT
jgi:hypothetical protein